MELQKGGRIQSKAGESNTSHLLIEIQNTIRSNTLQLLLED